MKPDSTTFARALEAAILIAAAAFVAFATSGTNLQDTANSRLATVWSLVHRGTWEISTPAGETPNPFERGTVDKVQIAERVLSSKPPVMPLLMTAEYWMLRQVCGLSLDQPEERTRIVYWMTLSLVGGGYLLALIFFLKLVRLFLLAQASPAWVGPFTLFSLAFATQLFGLATDLNNHVPATGLLMACLYFAFGVGSGRLAPAAWRLFLYGFTGALVFTLDMPLTIFVALAGLYLLKQHPLRAALWGGAGMLLPLALHFGIMLAVTGSPLPVQTRKALYLYESSPWRNPGGVDALNEPKPLYLFHMTFGRNGLFLLFPILLPGILEGLRALYRKSLLRPALLGGTFAFLLLTVYYTKSTNNYGGASYGFRWYLGAMPVLLLMALPMFARATRNWQRGLLALALLVSAYSAFESFRQPWGEDHEWPSRLIYGPTYEHHSPG